MGGKFNAVNVFHSRCVPGVVAVTVMLVGVAALYHPWLVWSGGHSLFGSDYQEFHTHRIRYAGEALFGAHPYLPAWYSRELLGTPFWSNMQSFPFIPTRLLLLLVDPLQAYALGVNLAAALAALFTYLYCRSIGFARLAAASSGWTFAASGFFAARVMAGHLSLLEGYPALPLLLWLIEKAIDEPSPDRRIDLRLLALGVASMCIVMAGHPQLPAYAFIAAALYLAYRARNAQAVKALGAIILGIGSAAFVLWPMFLLIGRSTRLLPLDAPPNDILFPYGRLATYLFPWKDGFPDPFGSGSPFSGYPNAAYFWDTVCYVGWLPLLAIIFLILRGKLRDRPLLFFIALGGLALILALPLAQPVRSLMSGTILRSPSRQVYLTTFALALAFGGALDSWVRNPLWHRRSLSICVGVLLLAAHAIDLGWHDWHFIHAVPVTRLYLYGPDDALRTQVADGRIAMDYGVPSTLNREVDDVGFFDSVIMARPYRALLDLTGAPPTLNIESLNGSQISGRALAATATKLVVTYDQRYDLPLVGGDDSVHVYAVPNPASRASFIPLTMARFLDEKAIHQRLRDRTVDLREFIMLPLDAKRPGSGSAAANLDCSVAYERPSSNVILVNVRNNQDGFLRVLESFDPGWTATVDGRPTPVLAADDFVLAVGLNPGAHVVRFRYATPGAMTGAAISGLCLPLIFLLAFAGRRHPTRAAASPPT
jgi:hypothetical protein